MNCKALFLDLDGTVRQTVSGEKFINDPQDQKLIKNARSAIEYFANRNYVIFGITNQGGVGAGYKKLELCCQEQKRTIELCPIISKIFFCPDFEGKQLGLISKDGGGLLSDKTISDSEIVYSLDNEDKELLGFSNSDNKEEHLNSYSSFRKPGTGILEFVEQTEQIDIKNSLFVGDRQEDIDCAFNYSLSFLWANQWREIFG